MKCSHASALFYDYLKQTISPSDRKLLEEHLNECSACQKQWEAYRFFFENSKIENDFPVPSQLNAKIKYTIHQAKNSKKVPFFRSKQVLTWATTCSFLLVAGIWGSSYYQEFKQQSTADPFIVTETAVSPTIAPTMDSDLELTQAPVAVSEPSKNENTKELHQATDTKKEVASGDASQEALTTNGAVVTETQDSSTQTIIIKELPEQTTRTSKTPLPQTPKSAMATPPAVGGGSSRAAQQPIPANEQAMGMLADSSEEFDGTVYGVAPVQEVYYLTLSKDLQEILTNQSDCTVLSENSCRVSMTKATLEGIIGQSLSCPENTTIFHITFE